MTSIKPASSEHYLVNMESDSEGGVKEPPAMEQLEIDETDQSSFMTINAYQKNGKALCCGGQKPDRCCTTSSWWREKAVGYRWVKPSHLVKSYIFPSHWVMIIRAVLVVYVTIVFAGAINRDFDGGYFFVYFTNLSFTGLMVYFWLVTYLSVYHFWFKHTPQGNLTRKPTWLEIFVSWLYSSSFTFHVIVPVVYWVLLGTDWKWSEKEVPDRWLNISRHGLDFVMIFIEFFLCRTIYIWGHLVIAIIIFVLYVFYAWVIYASGAFPEQGFPYKFVNYNKPDSFAYIAGIGVFFCFVWTLIFYLHWLKAYFGHHHGRVAANR